MLNILITGAASGLGLGFMRYYLVQHSETTIHAVDMAYVPVPSLTASQDSREKLTRNLKMHRLNVTDAAAVKRLGQAFDDDGIKLDLIIHCAGMRGLVSSVPMTCSADVARAETLEVMDEVTLLRTFEVNTIGTFLLLRAMLPSLRRAAKLNSIGEGTIGSPPKVAIMGSRMGSIGHMEVSAQGGGYAYRASKAALNAIMKTLSVDVPEVVWTVCHPGRVETALVSVMEDGAMPVEEAVEDCVRLIESLGLRYSGTFVDRFGATIPW